MNFNCIINRIEIKDEKMKTYLIISLIFFTGQIVLAQSVDISTDIREKAVMQLSEFCRANDIEVIKTSDKNVVINSGMKIQLAPVVREEGLDRLLAILYYDFKEECFQMGKVNDLVMKWNKKLDFA